MKKIRSYGWIPDVPDQRDFLYSAIKPGLKLPSQIDLRRFCSPVEDQGQLGSCTAQALAGNLEFLDKKPDNQYVDTSRLFIYYNERKLQNTISQDSGAALRIGIKSLKQYGACDESLWPYQIAKFTVKPSAACYKEAVGRTIKSYHRLISLPDMLACLAEGFPFVFGFTVYESFESAKTAKTGKVDMPKKTERTLGGHAVMAVGYDQKSSRFIVRNSWGAGWGMAGYFTIPYEYIQALADDFWTIRG